MSKLKSEVKSLRRTMTRHTESLEWALAIFTMPTK